MDARPFPPRQSSLSSPPKSGPETTSQPILLANLNPSSLWSFGKRRPNTATSPVKRKPLPPNSPALASNRKRASEPDQKLNQASTTSNSEASSPLLVRDLDQFPRGYSPLFRSGSLQQKAVNGNHEQPSNGGPRQPMSSPNRSRGLSAPPISMPPIDEQGDGLARSRSKGLSSNSRPPPLKMSANRRVPSIAKMDSKQPRTPGAKITQFFSNWRRNSASPDHGSSSTEPSDHGLSPPLSPLATSPQTSRYSARSFPHGFDTYKSESEPGADGADPRVQSCLVDQDLLTKVGQLEGELKEITCELAGSIKREMDLEDLVEKLQLEASGTQDDARTSDYYSDSSTSSVRLAAVEGSLKLEDFDKVKRQAEQGRARLKVDFSQRWQEEMIRRRMLETHVRSLETQISEGHLGRAESCARSTKHEELEASLEDARRGLAGERRERENVKNCLTSLRNEVEQDRMERNRLRDEVVPQLQAKLLSKNIEPAAPAFDSVHLHQEIQALRDENGALKEAQKCQQDLQTSQPRFNTISEEGGMSTCLSPMSPVGVSRSSSVARASGRARGLTRSGSLSRSSSSGGKSPTEPRETLAERIKDVEFQRDALHSAVRALLTRQECQTKEFERQIRALEQDRERALLPPTPRKLGYEKEVRNLRDEVDQLRRRADDALTQKVCCEKGLGGLKMDLDRSEQETNALRRLLEEHELALPDPQSSSLQEAYDQLQKDRLDATALVEKESSSRSVEDEQRLVEQLRQSAERSEGLAQQMSERVATNQTLRERLASAIGRGEKNQAASTGQITALESKLRVLEDNLTSAQQKSDAGVVAHEEEIRTLKESHNAQLHRLKAAGYRSPTSPKVSGGHGLSPLVSPLFTQCNPRLDVTTSGQGMRLDQALKTGSLEKKVTELESALENTDHEMQHVVERMNSAQIEVMELQTERDEALKQTSKLRTAIMTERKKIQSLIDRSTET